MIHLYTGQGKGKTSAAIGLGIRLLGNEAQVLLVSFLKDGSSGEAVWLETNSRITHFCQPDLHKFIKDLDVEELEQTRKQQLSLFHEAKQQAGGFDAVILDEFTDLLELEMLSIEEAVAGIKVISLACEVIITGHQAPAELITLADYYTEFVEHKHPYRLGVKARRGIEY